MIQLKDGNVVRTHWLDYLEEVDEDLDRLDHPKRKNAKPNYAVCPGFKYLRNVPQNTLNEILNGFNRNLAMCPAADSANPAQPAATPGNPRNPASNSGAPGNPRNPAAPGAAQPAIPAAGTDGNFPLMYPCPYMIQSMQNGFIPVQNEYLQALQIPAVKAAGGAAVGGLAGLIASGPILGLAGAGFGAYLGAAGPKGAENIANGIARAVVYGVDSAARFGRWYFDRKDRLAARAAGEPIEIDAEDEDEINPEEPEPIVDTPGKINLLRDYYNRAPGAEAPAAPAQPAAASGAAKSGIKRRRLFGPSTRAFKGAYDRVNRLPRAAPQAGAKPAVGAAKAAVPGAAQPARAEERYGSNEDRENAAYLDSGAATSTAARTARAPSRRAAPGAAETMEGFFKRMYDGASGVVGKAKTGIENYLARRAEAKEDREYLERFGNRPLSIADKATRNLCENIESAGYNLGRAFGYVKNAVKTILGRLIHPKDNAQLYDGGLTNQAQSAANELQMREYKEWARLGNQVHNVKEELLGEFDSVESARKAYNEKWIRLGNIVHNTKEELLGEFDNIRNAQIAYAAEQLPILANQQLARRLLDAEEKYGDYEATIHPNRNRVHEKSDWKTR